MAELTIENIIKMVVAVFVLIMVIVGAYVGFTGYILPYFNDFGFGEQDILGRILEQETKNVIEMRVGEDFVSTSFYIKNGNLIWENEGKKEIAGIYDGNKITVKKEYLGQDFTLDKLSNAVVKKGIIYRAK